jgi:endonuclease III
MAVFEVLVDLYPTIRTALDYENAWQLLVVTVLSAQTTDDNVNRVAPNLFARFPTAADLAAANLTEVEELVYSTGFYRQKARAIVELSQDVVDEMDGDVPPDLERLTQLRGVGRKTASVVLAEVWGLPAIAVDTHVNRVTRRLGLTGESNPAKIETDLKALYPEELWAGLSMRFIQFGRDICDAQRPQCGVCPLFATCRWPSKDAYAAR